MSNIIASLEKVILPIAVKLGKQPHVNAIKNGFIKMMPLTLVGAMFVLINNVFLSFGEGSFFYSIGVRLDPATITTLDGLKSIDGNGTLTNGSVLQEPYPLCTGIAEHLQGSIRCGYLTLRDKRNDRLRELRLQFGVFVRINVCLRETQCECVDTPLRFFYACSVDLRLIDDFVLALDERLRGLDGRTYFGLCL